MNKAVRRSVRSVHGRRTSSSTNRFATAVRRAAARVGELVAELLQTRLVDADGLGLRLEQLRSPLDDVRGFAEAVRSLMPPPAASAPGKRQRRSPSPRPAGRAPGSRQAPSPVARRPQPPAEPLPTSERALARRITAPLEKVDLAVLGLKPQRPKAGKADAFAATPFVLQTVADAGARGVSSGEVAARVTAAAPGRHVRPSALVFTLLTRLAKRGLVRRRAGRWFATA